MKKHIILLSVLFSFLWICDIAFGAIVVGRIAYVEGQIYRYMDADQSWVETFVESPAGLQDILAVGADSRAEIVFPNNLALRLDENAEMEILSLDEDNGSFVLHAGQARFYNRSKAARLTVETVRGIAKIAPGSIADMRADGESVVVAAVLGEATFQSFDNDIEKVEVISGSTSLEFHEDRIVADIGPIDRKWDKWCADRESLWSKNRLVRSEYLPETMQDYAYVLEPYGSWHRVYYRGYNYWAWKPRHVAVGWAPYTTGYWYDWQGDPVWIDHNPWGWVTHHHGHWVQMHGSWMWTPYVHVSHVPGVTTVGFNISFGRKYHPNWHPGRVRWIAHSSYVGWLPLAPWETYYGYRKWGARSVVVNGGVSYSINLNFSNHRYIDHAVIIPKHHFHQRGKPVVINNYNTVKIRNINKKTIVKNYKPLPTVYGQKARKHAVKITGKSRVGKRARVNSDSRTVNTREFVQVEKYTKKDERIRHTQKKEPGKRVVQGSEAAKNRLENAGSVEKKRERLSKTASPQKSVRSEGRPQLRKPGNPVKIETQYEIAASTKAGKRTVVEEKNRRRNKETRQTVVESVSTPKKKQANKAAALRKNGSGERKQTQRQTRITKRQVPQKEEHIEASYQRNTRKYAVHEKPEGKQREKQGTRTPNYRAFNKTQKERQENRQKTDKAFISTGFNNRRFR